MQTFAIVVSLVVTVVAVVLVFRTVGFMVRTIAKGRPDPTRFERPARRFVTMVTESVGHTRMLKWPIVGLAHWAVFAGFLLLFTTLVEAYGELFSASFKFPVINRVEAYSWVIEAITALTLLGILILIGIRLANREVHMGRKSRFVGSNWWQAYYVEWTIVAIALCVFAIRGLKVADGSFPYGRGAFISYFLGEHVFGGLTEHTLENLLYVVITLKIVVSMAWFITISLNANMGVAWHRFTAPFNIMFKRNAAGGVALGPLRPMTVNFEDPQDDDVYGAGKVEDFTWKQLLDLATCTECGRCQSQCPAWNTGKPLSPKLLITNLRDHMFAKAPYILDSETTNVDALAEAGRPLVGTLEAGGVIDPDVLWSCTTCGACVEQCPVDIEHVDTIMDMRRYQVLIESSFPSEAGTMMRNLEGQSKNPWGLAASSRNDWMEGLSFPVRVVEDRIPDDVEWLFWVGCAGALEDRSKKVTQAVAELLYTAGVTFAVLGSKEACTGDPARRLGNEYLFSELAKANVEQLNSANARKIVATCPHCFNTIANEYPEFGGNYEVVHHTQLLGLLIEEGRLVPATRIDERVTYHDPCYLGRHNRVYTPPREVLSAIAGLQSVEMHRCKERGFCCGAGGARMWMEERIGKQINVERIDEALATDPDIVSTACPYCMVMLSDAVTAKKQAGQADEGVEVLDVAQILARSIARPEPIRAGLAAGSGPVGDTPQETAAADTPQLAGRPSAPEVG